MRVKMWLETYPGWLKWRGEVNMSKYKKFTNMDHSYNTGFSIPELVLTWYLNDFLNLGEKKKSKNETKAMVYSK